MQAGVEKKAFQSANCTLRALGYWILRGALHPEQLDLGGTTEVKGAFELRFKTDFEVRFKTDFELSCKGGELRACILDCLSCMVERGFVVYFAVRGKGCGTRGLWSGCCVPAAESANEWRQKKKKHEKNQLQTRSNPREKSVLF